VIALGVVVACLVAVVPAAAQTRAPGGPTPAARSEAVPAERVQNILHMLDYVAVDYPEFVKDGKIVDQAEYDEQVEFVTQVRALLGELPARPGREDLIGRADRLVALVKARRPGTEVAALAGQLRWAVIKAYDVEVAPRRPPDLKQAAALYSAQCASCHGATGRGDGPAGRGLNPAPSNFHDADRMAQRSIYGLYSTITLGVDGTGMASFRHLGDEQRWALAFYVANLGQSEDDARRGAELWQAGQGRAALPDLASLATQSAREVQAQHGADAAALLSYLRAHPDVFAASGNSAIATSLRLLRQSLEAYRQGQARPAQDLAVSSYLEGFELVEASLDALDRGLRTTVEAEMIRYRGLLRDGAPLPQVEVQATRIEALLGQARDLLDAGTLPAGAAFLSALLILVREGLEAILIVAAMIALLVKANRRDGLPWVHGGWVAALLLGGLTWVVASYVVSISGATREVTEGITALVAAAILLYVGFWMHGKSHARRWQAYLDRRLLGALSGRTMVALALVSFLAVYREAFETVLFYQALALQAGPGGATALLGGVVVGAAALVVLSWVIVRGSLRLPLGLFFGASSVLLGLLAVVLAGKGMAALQEAGWLPIHAVNFPSVPLLGVYPNLQSLALQGALLAIIVGGFAYTRRVAARSA
jgi:high-affinity iron transporter